MAKIKKVFAMDYRSIGRRILSEFIEYINATTENALEELLQKRRRAHLHQESSPLHSD
jgi:hypothetical protein